MSWLQTLTTDAQRGLELDPGGGTPDPAGTDLGTEACPGCPTQPTLVLVEFADQPGAKPAFSGARKQFVNLSSADLVGRDPAVTSANQLGRSPPITVRVTPPQAVPVRLRLVREDHPHGFPDTSATLSTRERRLAHLVLDETEHTASTDAQGELLLEPGIELPSMGGYRFRVEGALTGGAFVRSSNAVDVRRRVSIRPVVRYAEGQAGAFEALDAITSDLDPLDLELHRTATLTDTELGVCEESELSEHLHRVGVNAMDSDPDVQALRPHCLSVIVGQFVTDSTESLRFERVLAREGDGFDQFPQVDLRRGDRRYVVVPLTSRRQLLEARAQFAGERGWRTIPLEDILGADNFADSVSVDLRSLRPWPATARSLRVQVRLKVISHWAVGWAYNDFPVIYLNMRDPNTDTILAADSAAALVIHELGHKLHLTATGARGQPDRQPHHYPTFTSHHVHHQGPHCSTGVPSGTPLWQDAAQTASTCTMWGSLKTIRLFCPECKTSLRKVDLSRGF